MIELALPEFDASVMEHALAYARCGWELMPRCLDARGRLIDALHGSPRTGLVGEAEVEAYWRDYASTPALAVVCGPHSGVFVLDVDQHTGGADGLYELRKLEAENGPLPPTPFVLSPSGAGRHIYFAWPHERRLKNGAIAPGVEVFGDRMAATLPPSMKSERPYRWSLCRHPNFLPFAGAPAWLLAKAALSPPQRMPNRDPGEIRIWDRYVVAALEAELAAVRGAHRGDRNNRLNRAAWSLARFVRDDRIGARELEAVLVNAAQSAGLPAREAVQTVRGALRDRLRI
jgi:Bifunctional DNA primase/polymerase, N-terminal